MFAPRVALASLSGQSDAAWAKEGEPYAGAAFLGGISLDEPTRTASRAMVERGREEFLPAAPERFVASQLAALEGSGVRPGVNVRTTTPFPLARVASCCRRHGAMLEVNAHCRQDEICAVGGGQALLRDPDRLCEQVATAREQGIAVSVKVRAGVDGVDLPAVARRLESAGASALHVDAMDDERVVGAVADATDLFLIANNGVRGPRTVREYLALGADAVSVGRPSDDPAVLERVRAATAEWFGGRPLQEPERATRQRQPRAPDGGPR